MDETIVRELEKAGIDTSLKEHFLKVGIELEKGGSDGKPAVVPIEEAVGVISQGKVNVVRPKPIPELFAGDAVPPPFEEEPAPEYAPFFQLIGLTALEYTLVRKNPETDLELHRLYRQLRKRPDGGDPNPLFSYLQGACRLYMSIREVSRAEFEGVFDRLAQSAKNLSSGPSSTNYLQTLQNLFYPQTQLPR